MSNEINVKTDRNCFISNYKPEQNREATHKDINVWVEGENITTGGKISNKNIKEQSDLLNKILNAVASLSGTDALEMEDLQLIDKLKGVFGINKIAKDLSAGVARLTMNDGTELRIDFETDEEKENYTNIGQKENIQRDENLLAMENTVKRINEDEKFTNKFGTVEMEKNSNGKYTGRIVITIAQKTLAGKLSNYFEKKYGMEEGTIREENKEKLDKCDHRAISWFVREYDKKILMPGDKIYLPYSATSLFY